MRQPPSPLLLSARKRRPRRNPPRGSLPFEPTVGENTDASAAQTAAGNDGCALLQRDGFEANRRVTQPGDEEPKASSR